MIENRDETMTTLTIVLDIGQFSTKAGFAAEDFPSLVFPSIVGHPKYHDIQAEYGSKNQQYYVGDEIQSLGLFKITYPINNGKITNWDHFQLLLDYIFFNLKIDPTMFNILFAIHPLFPKNDLQRLFEIFLEKYQCMAFYPVLDSLLTLYSGGFQTGLVVEIGDSSTRIVPIYKSYKITHSIRISKVGGRAITRHAENILSKTIGLSVDSSIQRDLVRVLKEKASFVSLDFKQDLKRSEQYKKKFSLPDGSIFTLSKERFMIPELLFDPSLMQMEDPPLHVAIMDAINSCDVDLRPELLNNIFLSGGGSLFQNLKARLYQELELKMMRDKKLSQNLKIIAPRERTFSVWIGGSILSILPEFAQKWITRSKYYNEGIPEDLVKE
ncbi:MAG: hypothetical protein ACTSU4_13200 [Promethearchaeota archaeon]